MANRLGIESQAAGSFPTQHNAREKKLAETIREDKNISDTFQQAPVVSYADNAGSPLPAEAAASTLAFHSGKFPYEYRLAIVESTGTAVYLLPYQSADGLELPLDADVTNGPTAVELGNGITANNRAAFVVGTDEPFFMEAQIKIDDVTDLDRLFCGFRKAAAYAADPDDYTDMAAFHIGEASSGGAEADGQVDLATILNNAATTYTDTTLADWADAATHTLRVEVNKLGQCTFKYDGAAPTATASFTFDSGDTVVPFLYADNATGSTTGDPGITLVSWKVGKL